MSDMTLDQLIKHAEGRRALAPEEARTRQIAAMVDDLSAFSSTTFREAREEIDRIEQTMLSSAAKAKTILENYVHLVLQSKEDVERLRASMEKMAAEHARLVNAETVS